MTTNTNKLDDLKPHLYRNSKSADDWRTPYRVFKNLSHEFGGFTLDAAADADNALCDRFWTREQNALIQDWSQEKTVFCNPPYTHCEEFAALAHLPETCLLLIPVRPNTTWWLRHIWGNQFCHEVRYFHQGLKFWRPEIGAAKRRAPIPSAAIVFHNKKRSGEIRLTTCCPDTCLPLIVISRGSHGGRPTTYNWEQLTQIIDLYERKRLKPREISEQLKIPLRSVHRIVERLT